MNASELKQQVGLHNPGKYFFDRKSMKFFGDTMRNYYVPAKTVFIRRSCGDIVECYELQRKRPVKNGLCGSAFFSVDGFKRTLGEVV